MRLLLISGHGDTDPGACSNMHGKQYCEATETIRVVKSLEKELSKYENIAVSLYPTSKNAYEDFRHSKHSAPLSGFDRMIEVHFNSCAKDLTGNKHTTGSEFWLPTNNTQVSKSFESTVLTNLSKLGFRNRGVKGGQSLKVINTYSQNKVISSLLEICFIDDYDDMKLYNESYDKVIQAIVDAIVSTYHLKKKTYCRVLKKVMFRTSKSVVKSNHIGWIEPGEIFWCRELDSKWVKIKYQNKTGYIVRSKVGF